MTSRYLLGPAEVKGTVLSGASANVSQTGLWEVQFELTGEGTSQWNAMATKVGAGNQIAIDLDGVVRSAPRLEVTEFQGRGVITGNFTQSEAKDLALVLRYGALPVQLDRQTVQTVSATLGRDSLRAGIAAGLVGPRPRRPLHAPVLPGSRPRRVARPAPHRRRSCTPWSRCSATPAGWP